jgi:hypothetical protein
MILGQSTTYDSYWILLFIRLQYSFLVHRGSHGFPYRLSTWIVTELGTLVHRQESKIGHQNKPECEVMKLYQLDT